MQTSLKNFFSGMLGVLGGRFVIGVVVLGLFLAGLNYFVGPILSANVTETAQAAPAVQAVAATPTAMVHGPGMADMPGMVTNSTTMQEPMPGMDETPVPGPANFQQPAGDTGSTADDAAELIAQMQGIMQSLQGVMGQLDQKQRQQLLAPTATPAVKAIDMQALMAELEDINRAMAPLMLRIQADLQGNPSAEELASVRSQVEQLNTRITALLNQLLVAQGGTPVAVVPAAPVTSTPMPNMGNMPGMQPSQPSSGVAPSVGHQPSQQQAMLDTLNQSMQQMQTMLQQIQANQMNDMANMPGTAPMTDTNSTPAAPPMAGMTGSGATMDSMMTMMDDMMAMMDDMMGMGGMSNMAPATPMPGMSGSSSDPMMDDMMMMMDGMMSMMDDMMMSMDGMMGMGNTSGSGSMSGSGGMMMDMGMPDM